MPAELSEAAELLGVREYAARRGCSHTAVSKAIRDGRLERAISRNAKGAPRIDPAIADKEWKRNTDPQQQRTNHRKPAQEKLFPDAGGDEPDEEDRGPSMARVQAVRGTFLAKITELDYRQRAGELVEAADVKLSAFRIGRTVRDAVLSIPPRISAKLAATTDEREVNEILTDELVRALRELSDAGER